MTDSPRPTLVVDRLKRALLAKSNRLDRLTASQVEEAFTEAGLDDVPLDLRPEVLDFVVTRWERHCKEQMLIHLAIWQPDEAQLARPN
jgi:hypothetical protein